jgi:hypothetical protein
MCDKFYTKNDIAHICMKCIQPLLKEDDLCIEPSAGNGSFIDFMKPNSIYLDIDPEDSRITKADFLTFEPSLGCVYIGNPPFGKQSSLAKKFIKRACKYNARLIAFILPKSFKKSSANTVPRTSAIFHGAKLATRTKFWSLK